ncbi:MAG: hypothetical protein AAGA46_16110 [Cyanobacteria bacterium P01_F01_bin.13]
MAQTRVRTALMPLSSQPSIQPSSQHENHFNALTLKQAANWQCQACGRHCRHQDESLDDFAGRMGYELDVVKAHPRRWMLHITKLYQPDSNKKVASKPDPDQLSVFQPPLTPPVIVLCGSCHRTYHNYRRWQHRQQQQRQQQEHIGQLTLSDIRLPLTGLQLSLNEWGTPYEIVNPQPKRRRIKSPKTCRDM